MTGFSAVRGSAVAMTALWVFAAAGWTGEVAGRLEWDRRLELSTPVSGVVSAVPVQQGQRVAKGDLLVELDQRLFLARLAQAEALLEQARQNRDEAVRELERTRELFDRTLLAVHDRQLAEIGAANARAAFRSAEAELTQARLDLEYSRITAPFDAWVVQVTAVAGETVVSRLEAPTLAVVVPAGRMRARVLLDQAQIAPLQIGAAARVQVQGQDHPGTVVGLGLESEPGIAERPMYVLEVGFDTPADRLLRPGEPAQITLSQ